MGTAVNKPYLADVMPAPSGAWNPITGGAGQLIGYRRNGAPIMRAAGGSQPFGGPVNGAVQPQGQPVGQQPAGFVPGLGGQPVPVVMPGVLPAAPPQGVQQPGQVPFFGPAGMQPAPAPMFGPQPGTMPGPVQPQGFVPQPYAPPGVSPAMPYGYGPASQPQQQPQFPFLGQPAGPPPGQPPGVQQQNGQHPGGVVQGQQQGQQPQGGGQPADGSWDKPYPQKPLNEMTVEEQNSYWKYHNRKLEDRIRAMGDYDQVRAQLAQLQQMTQTEWSKAVMEAEQRGASKVMDQAATQMVAVAFQGAANNRMTPDQITAALSRLDSRSFVNNGQVDIAAVHQYVDMIAPARSNGLVPLLPQMQQQLPMPQVPIGQPGMPLQPGQPGYGQQPTFGALPQPGQQFAPPQPYGPPQMYGQQALTGQVMPAAAGYGQIPTPGVPQPYQPAAVIPQPAVQASGLNGLPGLHGRQPGLPAAQDFGQGPAVPGPPVNAMQAGAAMAAARHGRTRSQQIAATR